jgi:Protein of unknown function (DUF3078).
MKKKFLVMVCLFSAGIAVAQDATVQELREESARAIQKETDTSGKIWRLGGLFSATLGQTALSNWAAGGDQFSFNSNGLLNLFAFYKKGKHTWDNSLDLALGYVNTTTLGTRKTDDRIDLVSKYGCELFKNWYLTGLFNFRSQFTTGYNYLNDTTKVVTSDFMAPAYVIVSAGLDYKPNGQISVFISPITSRWIIVTDNELSAQGAYGVDTGKHARNEIGAYLTANIAKEITKGFTYKGKLDMFSNYKNNPQNIDIFMTNIFSMNVYKGFSFNVGADLIYDDDVRIFGKDRNSPRLQVRQFIGIGYTRRF